MLNPSLRSTLPTINNSITFSNFSSLYLATKSNLGIDHNNNYIDIF